MTEKSKARLNRLPWKDWRFRSVTVCLALVVLVLGFWFLTKDAASTRTAMLDGFAMGSYVEQTVWGAKAKSAAAQVSAALADLENRISWRRDGDIAAVNENAGWETLALSKETGALLNEALGLCEASGGAFDITLGPVTRLWNFDNDPHLPEADELEAALALVDYRKLLTGEEAFWEFLPISKELFDGKVREDGTVLAEQGMAIDLGAIGKGAACDAALECYRQSDVKAAVIAVGGSVGLYGTKLDGQSWRVSVRNPADAGELGVLELPGGFVSTSGSYEKFFEQDGKTYCHLLDPRTGFPAESGLVSVTVWCPPDMEADYPGALSDGLATACFVLGLEDSIPLLEQYRAQALFVDEEGWVTVTAGLREHFTLTAESYTLAGEGSHGE